MDPLADIAVFVSVIDAGTFTAAADRLDTSKSVVSKTVSRLEQRLGVRLLNRSTRRLSPTDAGRALYERAAPALAALDEAQRDLTRLQAEPQGRVRLAVPMSFGLMHVAPLLTAIGERHPKIALEVRFDDEMVDVIGTGIDVALRIGELPDSSMVARRLCAFRLVCVASADYLVRRGTPQTPEDLARHDALIYTLGAESRQWRFHDAEGAEHLVAVQGRLACNSSLALREAALAGAGIAVIPLAYVGADLAGGRLRRLLPDHRLRTPQVHVVTPARRLQSQPVKAVIDLLAERFADPPFWETSAP